MRCMPAVIMRVLAACIVTALVSCGAGINKMRWQESVLLADGSVIQVERFVQFAWQRSFGVSGQTGEGEQHAELRFLGTLNGLPPWSAPLMPILIDRDGPTGEFVLITVRLSCDYWNRHGEPNPPYWTFRLRGGAWQPSAIPESFYGRRPNLFFAYDSNDRGDITRQIEERKRGQIEPATYYTLQEIARPTPTPPCTPGTRLDPTATESP